MSASTTDSVEALLQLLGMLQYRESLQSYADTVGELADLRQQDLTALRIPEADAERLLAEAQECVSPKPSAPPFCVHAAYGAVVRSTKRPVSPACSSSTADPSVGFESDSAAQQQRSVRAVMARLASRLTPTDEERSLIRDVVASAGLRAAPEGNPTQDKYTSVMKLAHRCAHVPDDRDAFESTADLRKAKRSHGIYLPSEEGVWHL
eukprot:TRINITY_DN133_c0_g1_i5.p1 TRINITY_DN133_c0_g1~~TRINITY_DN133_c0_g1_i5.p1  ORF type:complete len:207 (+),score=37.09 TRINITY_DN133_c0_g1_i5:66-686(+)